MSKYIFFSLAIAVSFVIIFFLGLYFGHKRGVLEGLQMYNQLSYDELRALNKPHDKDLINVFIQSKERERVKIETEIRSLIIPLSWSSSDD